MTLADEPQEPRHPPRIAGRGRPVARRKLLQVGGGALAGMFPAFFAWLVLGIGWFWCALLALVGAGCGAIAVAIGRPGWRIIHGVWQLCFGKRSRGVLPPAPLEPSNLTGPAAPRLADSRDPQASNQKKSSP